MKHIRESFKDKQSLSEYIFNNTEEQLNEGWRDLLSKTRNKIQASIEGAIKYLKGLVIQAGAYYIPIDTGGQLMPAISPLTMGYAYINGYINKNSTLVVMDREGKRITHCNTKPQDALKLYGPGNSLDYWKRMIRECEERYGEEMVNEVKMHTEDPEAKYNVIVDGKELQEEIEYHISHPKASKLLIWGAPGVGKTAILQNVLDKMRQKYPDYNLIVKTLSNETPDNFTLPKYIDVEGQDFATDVPKTWLPVYKPTGDSLRDQELDAKCGRGLLFIDELSRATQQVLNVILQLVNENIFNGYNLGSGWTIICASNRAEDEMSGQSVIGNALGNKLSQVFYEPTVYTWREWADKQNFISPLLLQWLSMPESENMSGGKFYYMDPNENLDSVARTSIMCTPRSWTEGMRQLASYYKTASLEGFSILDIPNRIIGRALNPHIPASAIDAFLAFLDVIRKIGNFDQAVKEVWTNGGKGLKIAKKDMNLITLPLAQLICSAHSDKLPTAEEFDSLVEWLISTKSDQLASYTLDVFKNVFFGMFTSEGDQNACFTLYKRRTNATSAANWKGWTAKYKPLADKWGVDLGTPEKEGTWPDYYPGLTKLSKAYGEIFKNAIVDGQEALG